jgi:hypothetical protein
MARHLVKSLLSAALLLSVFTASSQNDTLPSFDKLHYTLLEDYLRFVDTMEKNPITESYFRIRPHKHVAVIDFNDGQHTYTIHKKIKIYKSGIRYEKIKWFLVKGSFYHKLYVIKSIGYDYRYIKQYTLNEKLKLKRKIICLDDNYLKIHVYRPKAERGVKTYIKAESSLPASHQN